MYKNMKQLMKSRIIPVVLCVLLAFLMLSVNSKPAKADSAGTNNHTTVENGPKNHHTPTTYIWDMSREYVLPQGNYSNYLQTLGILFPGDKLRILPETDPNPGSHGYHGAPGIEIGGIGNKTVNTKIGPMVISDTVTCGENNQYCNSYTYITEITVEDAPVMLQLGGGGDSAAQANPGDNKVPQDKWGIKSVNYIELPKYVPIQYIYNLPNGEGNRTDIEGEFYEYQSQNPEILWMEDVAMNWNHETAQEELIGPTFKIYRPFLEGYSFVGFASDSHDIVSFKYYTADEKQFENDQWISDQVYFLGIQRAFTTKFNNTKICEEDEPIKLYFRFEQRGTTAESMGLDANGGTICGFEKRIVDQNSYNYTDGIFRRTDTFPSAYLPERAGYTFAGWYEDAECAKQIVSADVSPQKMLSELKSHYNKRYSPNYSYDSYDYEKAWHFDVYAGWLDANGNVVGKIGENSTGNESGGGTGNDSGSGAGNASGSGAGTTAGTDSTAGSNGGTGSSISGGTENNSTAKAINPLNIKGKTTSVKYSKLRKKAQTIKVSKLIKYNNKGQGALTYKLSSAKKGKKDFKKYFKLNAKTGKLKIKKGLKKGTYKVKISVAASGNTNYDAVTKGVTCKIKVK